MKERFQNYHPSESNQFLILRDNELFNRKLGLGFYSPSLTERYRKKELLISSPEPRIVWLKKETEELYRRITEAEHSSPLLVEGSLGQGKSALIYGLRTMFRENGLPYCYIDGHFISTPEEKILSSLRWAEENNAVVFWDSLDYLLISSIKKRKIPLEKHLGRSGSLISTLISLIDQRKIKLIGTSHDQSWLNKYSHRQLLELWNILTNRMEKYLVKGVFETDEEIIQFFSYAGLSPESIELILNIAKNYLPDLREYRIAKLLGIGNYYNSFNLRCELQKVADGVVDLNIFLEKLRNFINNNNEKRDKINGYDQ